MSEPSDQSPASLTVSEGTGNRLHFEVSGRLQANTISQVWRTARDRVTTDKVSEIEVDATQVSYCDGAGVGMLVDLKRLCHADNISFVLTGLDPRYQKLLDPFEDLSFAAGEARKPQCPPFVESVGRAVAQLFEDILELIRFIGELVASFFWMVFHPTRIRWRDVFVIAENVGSKALPIVGLISFLIGLIIAFQAAIPLKQFGAQNFVANLVAVSLVRELGPLMTAIVLAGRSGSAFAAEIGTMKVNEEINALTTMGLQPVRFLVVARVMAAMSMMPILSVFAILAGLVGGGIVYVSLGFSVVLYCHSVVDALVLSDFLGGLSKALVFGLLVGAVGCFRGLQTAIGASAVGLSTTRAVVTGITLIVMVDGLFSVAFYVLGI